MAVLLPGFVAASDYRPRHDETRRAVRRAACGGVRVARHAACGGNTISPPRARAVYSVVTPPGNSSESISSQEMPSLSTRLMALASGVATP